MNRKSNNKVLISILLIFLLIISVGLSSCSSTASKEDNPEILEDEKEKNISLENDKDKIKDKVNSLNFLKNEDKDPILSQLDRIKDKDNLLEMESELEELIVKNDNLKDEIINDTKHEIELLVNIKSDNKTELIEELQDIDSPELANDILNNAKNKDIAQIINDNEYRINQLNHISENDKLDMVNDLKASSSTEQADSILSKAKEKDKKQLINDNEYKINQFASLSSGSKTEYINQLHSANSNDEANSILNKAQNENNQIIEEQKIAAQQKQQNNTSSNNTISNEQSSQVLITRTGAKYHKRKCGNGTYFGATLNEAQSRGLTPCKKCF